MITKKQIRELCAQIVREFHPEKVILFGSQAYGTPTPDSDVDLLVVMPYEGEYRKQLVKMLNKIETHLPIDLLLRTPKEINERLELGDFFIKEITERGKVMYDKTDSGVGGQGRRRLERRANALSRA
ncbi:MAG TPA: nucleotidyltransferase domain-containing protein [Blastocatellia bacterium]|nr:nucleotidyltransferase domain-containing protein [Blastocatellia bacterium]HMV83500.1 nucleotidyltransferase domain-containing protein [Blastocatellia bacterium]HMX28086.1 nucleotidyltransferase domain-containing protein [Blastocatellia bacterium]HMY75320.1 nucleotidyltransferase domain-containing protein [Blastocatellia bacterium]HMZ20126.1 nucleotidyltransferase domain-containing protein [Blastocatellia bacterium]